jgi:hypothetical protein
MTPTATNPDTTPTATNPDTTPTATPTPTVESAAINVTGFSAFVVNIDPTDWRINISIVLDGAVDQDTTINATINVDGGQQVYGVTIFNGATSGNAAPSYIEEPLNVSPNCLTFVSGDTRVNLGVYAC